MPAKSLFEKVWERHVVVPETADTPAVLYIDLHLTHEVTSPQAFDVLRARRLPVRRLDRTLATMDHSTPTDTAQIFGGLPIKLARSRADDLLEQNGLGDWAKKPIRTLSKGMAQTVQLLGTLVHEPRLIVLDEPFSGLDAINQGKLERLIRSRAEDGVTIIFSTL